MKKKHDILVVIPAFNEEETIAKVIDDLRAEEFHTDIVVVDDGSRDGTARIAESKGVSIIRLPCNLGIGGAVQTGYRYALERGYRLCVQVDADGQHGADSIERLVEPVASGETDIAIGSRYLVDNPYRPSMARKAGITILSKIVSWIVGIRITDPTSGFRAVNGPVISAFCVQYPDDYPEVESIVLLHRMGFRIQEVGVRMEERAGGRSSITFTKSIYYMIKVLLAVGVELLRKSRRRTVH